MTTTFRQVSHHAALVTAMTLFGVTAPTLQAQEQRISMAFSAGGPMNDTSFRPVMTERELKHYGRVLTLDETQSLLARELLGAYRQSFDAEVEKIRTKQREMREEVQATGDFSIFGRQMGPLMEGWNKTRERLDEELIVNLRSLLREDQADRWPIFEREQRRAKMLPNSRLGGEDVDLLLLVGDLELSEEELARVAPMLEQWAVEIDIALTSRQAVLEPLQREMIEKMGDREAIAKIWEQGTKKRIVVRDVNERTLAGLRAELGPELGDRLHAAYLKRAFPLAFETTRAHRMFEAVRKHAKLAPEQEPIINDLESQFNTRLDGLTNRLIDAIRKEEQELPPFIANMQPVRDNRGGRGAEIVIAGAPFGQEPYGGLLKERFDLAKNTITQIESVLTPAQKESLPAIDMSETVNAFVSRAVRFQL